MDWQPHITVATIVEDNGRFLMVEELKAGRGAQPARRPPRPERNPDRGRRARNPRGNRLGRRATGVLGIYLYTAPSNGVTYQRVLHAKPLKHHPDYQLDDGIVGAKWLTRDELIEQRDSWRSELIIRCIDDYLDGQHFSLELIRPSL
jgi:hypothetical protein